MIESYPTTDTTARRVDLHCHSEASNKAAEVLLSAIRCPECYSAPADVYRQAKLRGMDFVTITDHDSIEGVGAIVGAHADVLVGEELTCWFPQDRCKMHVLVYGINADQHAQLQAIASDIYKVAAYLEQHNIAHGVAHPIYRQNDRLERWHLERLLLMFKGFECLNGAHSALHRQAFEPMLDALSRGGLMKLAEKHALQPRWPEPWIKARLGGSDDHGLLNIGKTWTEFPPDAMSVADVLQCLRDGTCKPGGEAGSSAKLAHTFYGVAVRYYSRHILPAGVEPNLSTQMLQMMVGERPALSMASVVRQVVSGKLKKIRDRILAPFNGKGASKTSADDAGGTTVLRRLFTDSLRKRLAEYPSLRQAAEKGLPPLGEHEEMFRFVSALNRDVAGGIAQAIDKSIADASFTQLFDVIGAILAHQFVLLPYYFAVFHQNKERHLLRSLTGVDRTQGGRAMHIGLFTDTLDEVNGVSRFIRDMARQADEGGYSLVVHTCVDEHSGDNVAAQTHSASAPSPGTPGEGRGEGSRHQAADRVRTPFAPNPHPSPLPEYRARGKMRKAAAPRDEASSQRSDPQATKTDRNGSHENGDGRHTKGGNGNGATREAVATTDTFADVPGRKNFQPLLSRPMPYYQELQLNLPPLLDVLEWADRQQFDAIHISTPGPMGLCGWLVAKMLRVPMVATYHTDFPAYVEHFTKDHRAAGLTAMYMQWLYCQASTVYTRSRGYLQPLRELGIRSDRLVTLPAGVDLAKFSPRHRDPSIWSQRGVTQPRRLLYCGRVSIEKNLPLLVEAFKQLCARRSDTALVVAGDGPYLATMRQELTGTPAYFLGYQKDDSLVRLYASSDLLVFPSRTDTLGQVVLEAQASGLPAIVSDEGGPREIVLDDESGLSLPATDAAVWSEAIDTLLNDEDRRQRFAARAIEHVQRWSLEKMFQAFWASHVAAEEPAEEDEVAEVIERAAVGV